MAPSPNRRYSAHSVLRLHETWNQSPDTRAPPYLTGSQLCRSSTWTAMSARTPESDRSCSAGVRMTISSAKTKNAG